MSEAKTLTRNPMPVARPITLVDVAAPRSTTLTNILLVATASLVTAACAQLEIRLPWTVVPLTGQTFAVLLSGAVLGARRAFLAQLLYLAEGASGLPFFAGGAAGVAKLLGPTGGYLIGFPFAAALTGLLAERGWDRRPVTMFLAMLAGSTIIFGLGLAQLSAFVPKSALLASGLLPFVAGDLLKSALAAGLFPVLWKLVSRLEGPGSV
jgi:biotin transport system substrate-specific component